MPEAQDGKSYVYGGAIDPEQMAELIKEVYGWKLRIGHR